MEDDGAESRPLKKGQLQFLSARLVEDRLANDLYGVPYPDLPEAQQIFLDAVAHVVSGYRQGKGWTGRSILAGHKSGVRYSLKEWAIRVGDTEVILRRYSA